jgi:hypothetical protein
VFVQTQEKSDFGQDRIKFLESDFLVDVNSFQSIPSHSCVILDDFKLKQKKEDFCYIIDYTLRHRNIILFLVCHSLVYNNLFYNILQAPFIFIAYSTVGESIMR